MLGSKRSPDARSYMRGSDSPAVATLVAGYMLEDVRKGITLFPEYQYPASRQAR